MAKTLPNGAVIMIDGPDGVGKTTQVKKTTDALKADGYTVWPTRVNGGTPIGEALRDVMLLPMERPPLTDLHIHLAQQYSLALELERKRKEGAVVVVDRSPLSIVAVQIYGSGLDQTLGYATTEKIFELFRPELVVTYMASLEVLQGRLKTANHPYDYFSSKSTDFILRVIDGYVDATKRYGAVVIDGTPDINTVHASTMRQVNVALERAAQAAPPSLPGSEHSVSV